MGILEAQFNIFGVNGNEIVLVIPMKEDDLMEILNNNGFYSKSDYYVRKDENARNKDWILERISEYDEILKINELFTILNLLSEEELIKYRKLLEMEIPYSINNLINLIFEIDNLKLERNIKTYTDLVRTRIKILDVEKLKDYIDIELIGKEIELKENGRLTEKGYFNKLNKKRFLF